MFEKDKYLDLDTRKQIYECIKKSPGLHFREIQRRTQMATGSLDYHIHFLQKNGLVRVERTGGFIRFYPSDSAFAAEEKDLLSLLRQENMRHILIFLIRKGKANASEISSAVGVSPSSLSPYLRTLCEKSMITQQKRGRFRFYRVIDKKRIVSGLVKHKSSFLDKIVDSFVKSWEE